MASVENGILAVVAILAGLFSGGLIIALMPWLKAYALARPNARSSHREPTPQGGGIAVIVATLLAAWLGDRKSTRLNSSHLTQSRMPSSA